VQNDIRLVIADVDGTLVTNKKVLTARSVEAVERLRESGIRFSITSGRPPLGLKPLIDALGLTDPIAAFNGGALFNPDLSVIEQSFVPEPTARRVVARFLGQGLDAWVYTEKDWLVRDPHAPHVAREQGTVNFAPKVVSDFTSQLACVIKIVGVSDDYEAVAQAEAGAQADCGIYASATRSQPYYLDVTHPDANKGNVVTHLSKALGISTAEIATIGDGRNDVLMFQKSGLSIAMGNADPEVQKQAQFVTNSNENEGFAEAMESFVLRRRRPAGAA
jgi:Cof subfamily protein (haloacid dehalogenase superfamily)